MSTSRLARRAAVILAVLVPVAGIAHASGAGDFAPPKTKKECLHRLKGMRADWKAERRSYPGRKQAAEDKVATRQDALAALKAKRKSMKAEIDAIMNSDTSNATQADIDAMNARIDELTTQLRKLAPRIDTAGGKVDEARMGVQAVVDKYLDDKKNYPPYLKQIADYCAKM